MKKFLSKIFSRLVFTVFLMLVQVAVLVIGIWKLNEKFYFVYALLTLLDIVLVIYINSQDENPSYKLSWIMLISIIPVFGGLTYLYLKIQFSRKIFIKAQERSTEYGNNYLHQSPDTQILLENENQSMSNLSKYVLNVSAYPVYNNTKVKYYSVGELQFEDMITELKKAEKFIFMEYFIISAGYMFDTIADILKQKAKEGVEIRVMYDGVGTQINMPEKYFRELSECSIKCKIFNPFRPFLSSVQNNRDHRKILVIDGHTAFNGGTNLADEYINRKERFGHWKDTALMIKGDAVWNLTVMFLQLWEIDEPVLCNYLEFIPKYNVKGNFANDGFVQPFSDSPLDDEHIGELVYMDIINNSQKYLYITTPYLIPDNELLTSLKLSAKKGVDVRIITPHIPDKWYAYAIAWTYYPELIKAGVKIYEYTPGFIHAKNFVSDDNVGVVGTINLDYRSLYLHFECATILYKSSAIKDIKNDFIETQELSQLITLKDCSERPLKNKIAGYILRMFAPLL